MTDAPSRPLSGASAFSLNSISGETVMRIAEIPGSSFTPAAGEEERIKQALEALAKDPHAPREISIKINLHVHREYPKHVPAGKDKDGNPFSVIVNNEAEEKALLAKPEESGEVED
jgi:hypothetical protein